MIPSICLEIAKMSAHTSGVIGRTRLGLNAAVEN